MLLGKAIHKQAAYSSIIAKIEKHILKGSNAITDEDDTQINRLSATAQQYEQQPLNKDS